jgi:predicted DNA-binding antitoxin AbrB/MazE fold protein
MSGTIRARVKKGALEPLEKLGLPEGSEVTVTILATASKINHKTFQRAAGAWKGTIDANRLIRSIYASRRVSTRRAPRL